ncbi:MAG TPA: cytochrome C [Hyphomicrobiaceae bacterium]|nr:cytochrome C [Hyphomicrobiaceae bacterium]
MPRSTRETSERTTTLRRFAILMMAGAALLWPAAALSQSAGDPKRGLDFAERTCSDCHAVGLLGVVSPRPDAAPFVVIARVPGINERSLLVFFQTPHKNMPNLIVTGQDRDDLIAYIMTLKKD